MNTTLCPAESCFQTCTARGQISEYSNYHPNENFSSLVVEDFLEVNKNEFEVSLPVSKKEVKFKLLTGKEEIQIEKELECCSAAIHSFLVRFIASIHPLDIIF